jgi:hypothetical protein
MAVAVASVSALLLGAAVHRSSPLPDGLALSSEVGHQEARLQKTKRIMMAPTQTGAANMSVSLPTQPDTWLQIRPLDGSDRPAFTGKLGSICLKARIAEALVVTDNSVLGDDIGFAALSRLETI